VILFNSSRAVPPGYAERSEESPILRFVGWSWRRGLFPPPLIVVLSEAKDLRLIFPKGLFYFVIPRALAKEYPIQSKGAKVPLSNLPQKELNFFRVELEEGLFTSSI